MKEEEFYSKSKEVVTLSRNPSKRPLIRLNKEKFYIGGKLYDDLWFYAMDNETTTWEALDILLRESLDRAEEKRKMESYI